MTLIACSIAVSHSNEVSTVLDRAIRASDNGAQLIEWRVDELANEPDGDEAILKLVRESPLPCIVTCRPNWEGGEYTGDELHRREIFETLLKEETPPRYIDIELKAWKQDDQLRMAVSDCLQKNTTPRGLSTSLILSTHDFKGRPSDLIQRVEAMTNEPACSVAKVAWQARSLRDNLEAFDLLSNRKKPMIAHCMGQFGLMSRILAPKFGGLLTYATDEIDLATAEGQPTLSTLHNLYRFGRISPTTSVYGVIGWPISHSRSPHVHNAGFEAINHDAVYMPLPIPPEYEHFKATVSELTHTFDLDFRGGSVTIPHKENLVRYVQECDGTIDPTARESGSANTLIISESNELRCTNLDGIAAMQSLCNSLSIQDSQLAGKRVALFGAGGAARAIASKLSNLNSQITIFNRTPSRAQQIADQFKNVTVGSFTQCKNSKFDIIINVTPIGMSTGPAPDKSPVPDCIHIDHTTVVFDTVYTPARTPLIQIAESRGAHIIKGADMFLRQAAMQFEMWTGSQAPMDVFQAAL